MHANIFTMVSLIEQGLSGSEISPKYNEGLGKTQNFLTGYGISGPLVGKRDSLKSCHEMRNWQGKRVFGIEMTEVRDARS